MCEGYKSERHGHDPLRLLYVSCSTESEEAIATLDQAGIDFVRCDVEDRKEDSREEPKPPCFITSDGRFSGLRSIKSYATILDKTKIRSLAAPLRVYADESCASRRAIKLLESEGLAHEVVSCRGAVSSLKIPFLLFRSGTYEGLEEVEGLVRLLKHWSRQNIELDCFV